MSADPTDELARRARAHLGKVLKGKYRLDGLLGVGGMAAVYAATHRNGNRVAVKMLHPELSLNSDVLGRFVREGYVANKVEHRGTVRVLDDDAEEGAVFLVMELLEGETLDALWERNRARLPVKDVLSWANQLLDVLAAAHDKGIVHRDIKPENLFLTRDGVLKVLDFGIARVRENAGGFTVTRTGNPFGTPAFMPPEQALGRTREIDARSDLYAVGATMFTLLTGKYVHEAETPGEMVVNTATRSARSLLSVDPQMPAPLALVVDRALAFDKGSRWPDARTMQQAVRVAHLELFGVPLPALEGSVAASLASGPSLPSASPDVDITGPTLHSASEPAVEAAVIAAAKTQLGMGPSRELVMTAPPTSTFAPKAARRPKRLGAIVVAAGLVLGGTLFAVVRWGVRGDDDLGAGAGSAAASGEPTPTVDDAGASPTPGVPASALPRPTVVASASAPVPVPPTTAIAHGNRSGSGNRPVVPKPPPPPPTTTTLRPPKDPMASP